MNSDTETKVKYASFLMIPLKYDEGSFDEKIIMSSFDKYEIQTLDLNENIKDRLNGRGETAVGKCYGIPREWLVNKLGLEGESFRVKSEDGDYSLNIDDSYLYIFHTDVAFMCLQLLPIPGLSGVHFCKESYLMLVVWIVLGLAFYLMQMKHINKVK